MYRAWQYLTGNSYGCTCIVHLQLRHQELDDVTYVGVVSMYITLKMRTIRGYIVEGYIIYNAQLVLLILVEKTLFEMNLKVEVSTVYYPGSNYLNCALHSGGL